MIIVYLFLDCSGSKWCRPSSLQQLLVHTSAEEPYGWQASLVPYSIHATTMRCYRIDFCDQFHPTFIQHNHSAPASTRQRHPADARHLRLHTRRLRHVPLKLVMRCLGPRYPQRSFNWCLLLCGGGSRRKWVRSTIASEVVLQRLSVRCKYKCHKVTAMPPSLNPTCPPSSDSSNRRSRSRPSPISRQ
ncbi:hypothetical protein HER10_EVM0011379 [Colletotrichum scovillei]|uniref:uncharacterized protein n=1 Tax=Colletotrichum scovillei TaxID=1209932 RepID=UPI0015C3DA3E|nr:uncharacterized protein HER10_EVM0011379 [Colletotrichum scovillei]KAF4772832.1 hypothetical protein HER10_EVM0011379 [Colletotrichum scovillei]